MSSRLIESSVLAQACRANALLTEHGFSAVFRLSVQITGGEGAAAVGVENGGAATSYAMGANAALEVTLRKLSHYGEPCRPHKIAQS